MFPALLPWISSVIESDLNRINKKVQKLPFKPQISVKTTAFASKQKGQH
jgi:hypothetical protein